MNALLYGVLGAIVLFFAYKTSLVIGLAVTAVIIALAVYSYIPTFYAVKGQNAFSEGKYKEAARYYKKAMNTGRAKLQIRINYCYVLMRVGKFAEAEKLLDEVIRVGHLKKEEYRNMAKQQRCMVYYKTGRLDEALADAQEMFDEGYKNTVMYAMLGFFKFAAGQNINDVTKFCEEAYDYNDEDRDIRDNLSMCYLKLGRYEEAKEISDKILEDSPKFVEAYYHGAQIAKAMGDYSRAAELLENVKNCNRSKMTTVSEEDVEKLKREVSLRRR